MITSNTEDDDDITRFEQETAGVNEPVYTPVGEVIPPGGEEEEDKFEFPVDDFINEELVSAFLALPANMMARKTGEEWWRLEEEEIQLLGKSSTPGIKYLVNKYLSTAAGPLAGIAASLAVVYGPRVMRQAQESRLPKSERESHRNSQRESASSSANGAAENQPNNSEWGAQYEE